MFKKVIRFAFIASLTLAIAAPLIMVMEPNVAIAASKKDAKKPQKGRAAYTKEQQKMLFDEAVRLCRKAYGVRLERVKVDYLSAKLRYWCWVR